MQDLTRQEIQILLQIIGKSSMQVDEVEQFVLPIKNKLQIQLMKLNNPNKESNQSDAKLKEESKP